MAMGIVSDKEFDSELSHSKSHQTKDESKRPVITGEVVDIHKGRGEGNLEVPNNLRKIIGETSITEGRPSAVELAKQFGISPSSVSAYGVGATSTSSYADTPNGSHIATVKEHISKRARNKLMLALRHITSEKLDKTNARDVSTVAKNMAVVVKHMERDENKLPANNGPTFVFYSPQFRNEESYEIVIARE